MSSGVETLNANAEQLSRVQALRINTQAAQGLQSVLRTNLGPRGTLKMLVGGAGQLKLTKDGSCLLSEMQIQHPTAVMIARTANATDESVGDGTTSTVLFCGELLKQAERYLNDGLHPRALVDGFDRAKILALEVLEKFKVSIPQIWMDRDTMCSVCRTSLTTKVRPELANLLTEIVTDALLTIRRSDPDHPGKQLMDLHMVEILTMQHRLDLDTRLVKGLVLDHGSRHPDMPKRVKNAYILTCNVSLEYEKSEITAGFHYKNAEEREKMVAAERKFVDDKVKQIVEFKNHVCTEENGRTFVIINQKGIDPLSLDILARAGILALRRAKRRNMERITLACGGVQVNSVDDLTEDILGKADDVYEVALGEEKFTFIEGVENPTSCTILIKGPNGHSIEQMKDAVRDGLRAVKNAIDDGGLCPGGGAFEIAAYHHLMKSAADSKDAVVLGREKLGVRAFAEALLVIPKSLAENSGLDVLASMLKLQEAYAATLAPVGLDLESGEPASPELAGIWDNVCVKRSVINLSTVLASQLLLVDEVMRAGRGSRPDQGPGPGGMEGASDE